MKGLPFVVIAVTCHLQAYPDVHDVSALPSSVGYSLAHHRSGYKESAAGMPFADLTLEPGTRAFIFQSMGMIRERSSYREGGCAFVRAERRECVCQGDSGGRWTGRPGCARSGRHVAGEGQNYRRGEREQARAVVPHPRNAGKDYTVEIGRVATRQCAAGELCLAGGCSR